MNIVNLYNNFPTEYKDIKAGDIIKVTKITDEIEYSGYNESIQLNKEYKVTRVYKCMLPDSCPDCPHQGISIVIDKGIIEYGCCTCGMTLSNINGVEFK